MKTKFIILIIIGLIISGSMAYVFYLMYDCMNPPSWMKGGHYSFHRCWGLFLNGYLPDYPDYPPPMNLSAKRDSAWITSAEDELYSIGCDKPILSHLARHSNLLDYEFDGNYGIEDIGLEDGISQEKFEECVDYILEKRISMELENEN